MENKDRMVFSITAYGKTVTIDVSDDIMIYDFLDQCRDLALAMGYEMSTWKTGVIEMAEYYTDEEERQVEKNLQDYGGVSYDYLQKTPKVYTGKSDLITHWGPLSEQKPTKEYTDWINKNIPDTNC